ncbi:MAG: Rrf2 family transcriptional regulator [Nitrospinae bacterium]|nr:Rrf2 family transcriptional regulator [Nitrospinota bacterium]
MKFTSRGRYAVRAMIDLAYHTLEHPVSLATIAVRQGISQHYLEQLFVRLRRAELVRSVRGPGGGYFLAKEPIAISVRDIFLAVDESLSTPECEKLTNPDQEPCDRLDECVSRVIWKRVADQVAQALNSVSLEDLCMEREKLDKSEVFSHTYGFNI